MRSFKKATLYGSLFWLVWVSITVVAYETLPQSLASSAFYVSMKTVLLAVFAVLLTIRYMKVTSNDHPFSAREGITIGFLWAAIMIVLDMSHYLFMSDGFKMGTYVVMFATSYLMLPVVAGSLMGWLRVKR